MKPQLLKVQSGMNYSFSVRHEIVPYFHNRWHYHPEIELVYIEQGSGTQFVGDSIQRFGEGDVLLVGANLPHYWRCDEDHFIPNSGKRAEATVVHFLHNFWSDEFLELPENKKLKELLESAKKGISIDEKIRPELITIIKQMLTAGQTERIILLLEALVLIKNATNNKILSSVGFNNPLQHSEKDTINKIYAYSLANFKKRILLAEISEIAHISPNSFCRYFKARTRKTFSKFLMELRIGYACKLFLETDLNVTEVCFECGFNTQANFYKCFKSIKGKPPYEFKRQLESQNG